MRPTKYVKHIGFDSPILINSEDFDPAVHSELDAEQPKSAKKAKSDKDEKKDEG